jgi:hypothetical protein
MLRVVFQVPEYTLSKSVLFDTVHFTEFFTSAIDRLIRPNENNVMCPFTWNVGI